jgi:hypothetical protein
MDSQISICGCCAKDILYRAWSGTANKNVHLQVKVKVIPQLAEVAQGVPGRIRPRLFLTFGTTRVVGHQPYTPTGFAPGEIPGTHFQRLSQPQSTLFHRGEPRRKSPVTPLGIDPGTVRLVEQCLNHYATPGPPPSTSSVIYLMGLVAFVKARNLVNDKMQCCM